MTGTGIYTRSFWCINGETYFAIVRYASICSAGPALLSSRGSRSGRKLQPGGPAIAIITPHLENFKEAQTEGRYSKTSHILKPSSHLDEAKAALT